MGVTWRAVLTLGGLALAASASAATVEIYANGERRAALTARPAPYTTNGPSVSVYLLDKKDAKTPDGRIVTGFRFIAWDEGDATRVVVFALVPRAGARNVYLPGGRDSNLARRDFSTHLIPTNGQVIVSQMKELGVAPMELRVIDE